ncbi:NACHT domain-containing protein [Halopseudomonas sp.]|uniref:NACHT domain-containing protein n=1 Tax=Halopseudomonas sp. TaxID=2901191 RepID=UPI00300227C1|tara:strand:+ start:413 stop:2272 length:1860 start_codon:yes stop_codon:yes gene_type:complete
MDNKPDVTTDMLEAATSSAISKLVEETILPITRGITHLSRNMIAKRQVILETCFTEYTKRCYQRYSKTKTLLYRETPVKLKNFYVRTDLTKNNRKINENGFLDRLKEDKRVVVSGTAGSGKSTFCKSIFIETIESKKGTFPIFLELRHLNSKKTGSLFDFVTQSLSTVDKNFKKEHLDIALRLGKILLIFDGFDEIDSDKRDACEKELIELSNKYHNLMVIVSSRIDSRFSSWEEFHVYYVNPLDKKKSLELIAKLEYDTEVQEKFLHALDQKLYETHTSFASNPLLLTMMLLTYEQIAEIPNKIHLFYEQAFLTLFNKHDSLKSLYKRKSSSELPLDDFKKILSAFCALSYLDRLYTFSEEKIFDLLSKSIKISGKTTKESLFLTDLLDSVCILQRDGLEYTFTHRSFQEYFASLFMTGLTSKNKFEILDKFALTNDRDMVMPMLYDMHPDLVETEWVIPRLRNLLEQIEAVPNDKFKDIRIFALFYDSIGVRERNVVYIRSSSRFTQLTFIRLLAAIYDGEIHKKKYGFNRSTSKNKRAALEELMKEDMDRDGEDGGPRDLHLSKPEKLTDETISRIKESGVFDFLGVYENYCRVKLEEVQNSQRKKTVDLEQLLLG